MNVKMRYVTTRLNKDRTLRHYWQRKDYPLTRLPVDPAERWRMVENLNRDADGAAAQEIVDGTVGWLVDEYRQTDSFRDLSFASRRVYDRWLDEFVVMWGAVPILGITRKLVVDFAKTLEDRPAVRGQAIAVLSNLLNRAMYYGLITTNPCRRLRLRKPKPRDVFWLPSDMDKFTEACAGHRRGAAMALAVKVLLYTGQRPGDALALSRTSYADGAIRLRQQKTGTLIDVPAHAELRKELDNLDHDDTRIIPIPGTRGPQYKLFNRAFVEIRRAAGLEHLQARDLRRTAVVMLAEAGATIPEISAVTGHSINRTQQIIDTYFVRTKPMAQSAISKWERHIPSTESNVETLKSNVGVEK